MGNIVLQIDCNIFDIFLMFNTSNFEVKKIWWWNIRKNDQYN